jgi:Anti-sigma-K factor rskA
VSEELTTEDRALLAALAALQPEPGAPPFASFAARPAAEPGQPAREPGQPTPPGDAAEAETLARLYHEVLGLLPFALAPAAPPPEVKRRLMTRLAEAEQAAGLEPAAAPAPAAIQPDPVSAATLEAAGPQEAQATSAVPAALEAAELAAAPPAPEPSAVPAATLADHPGRFAPAARSRSASVTGRSGAPRWLAALAAALILALLGTCGWLLGDLHQRREAIARLAEQRDAALRHAGEVEARLGRLTSQVSSLRDSFSVVTSPAVEVCNLRAVTPEQAAARGMLFVAADHQHWTMSLHGLRPPAGGKVYQLWFVADQGMVSGGTFAARPGAPVELGSPSMPAGTHVIRITLENLPGARAPTGPDVLRNADTLHTI